MKNKIKRTCLVSEMRLNEIGRIKVNVNSVYIDANNSIVVLTADDRKGDKLALRIIVSDQAREVGTRWTSLINGGILQQKVDIYYEQLDEPMIKEYNS